MDLKNGYKVIYEIAADGKRTFYAATSEVYPTRDAEGKIIDTELASFNDADFVGKTIYEYAGKFYVSKGAIPEYDENGMPKDTIIEGFDKVFVEDAGNEPDAVNETPVTPVAEPVVDPVVEENETPEVEPEDEE